MKNALKSVKYPGFTRDIVSFGLVKSIQIDNGDVKVQLALATNDPNVPATIKNDAEQALHALPGVRTAKVLIEFTHRRRAGTAAVGAPASRRQARHRGGQRQGRRRKSTVAANLAVA